MNQQVHIHKDQVEHVEGNMILARGQGTGRRAAVTRMSVLEKNRREKIGQNYHLNVGSNHSEKVGSTFATQAGQEIYLKAGQKVVIESDMQLMIKGAGGFVLIDASGVTIQGTMVKINCGGSRRSRASPPKLDCPQEAKPTDPEIADDAVTGQKSSLTTRCIRHHTSRRSLPAMPQGPAARVGDPVNPAHTLPTDARPRPR